MNRTILKILSGAAGLAVAAAAGAGTFAVLAPPADTVERPVTVTGAMPAATSDTLSVAEVYERAHTAVVEITVAAGGSSPFGPSTRQGQGSGFVYDEDGHIVTNQHVVDGAETISVLFSNGETYEATLVGSDASTDLAVLKVDAPATLLTPLELADSSELEVGEGVVAIGSPFGLELSVTAGIVSALDRQMEALNGFTINNSIQTDAAINHGNSGGPLLDLEGRVVGVNAQIASESGGNNGVGFAIPSNTVRSVVSELVSSGSVRHAYLGVGLADVPAAVAEELGSAAGVAVTEVRPGTPASDAGLRAATGSASVAGQSYPTGGDVITAVDGRSIATAGELQTAVDAERPGDTISITYTRDGESRTVEVELAERPA